MYYILECPLPLTKNGEALMEIHNTFRIGQDVTWRIGEPIDEPIPVPIEIDFDPYRGYQGPPMEMKVTGIPIMSERLANALIAAGVDNVELFEAILRNTATNERYSYRAFNIVGAIAAADLGKSEWESYDGRRTGSVSFHELVLDEKKCRGALMFRLAENLGAIVVHEHVRQTILASGIDTLRFLKPEEWMQI